MSTDIAPIQQRRELAIGLLLTAQIFFVILDSSAKLLGLAGMATEQIIFVRYFVHLLLMIALFMPMLGVSLFRTRHWKLHLIRALALLGSSAGNFIALKFAPMTVVGALNFTTPLFICLLSVPLLGERVGWRRMTAVLVGFVGTIVVVRPGTEAFNPIALTALVGAMCGAIYSITSRMLAGIDRAATQTTYVAVVAIFAIAPFAVKEWQWPTDFNTWMPFILIGIAGMIGHQLIAVAYRFATPAALAPFQYVQLTYAAVSSWIVFNQPPDEFFYLGAALIAGSGIYIWARERRLDRKLSERP